ncbi:MAG: guanylate kinase [Bacteroidales bacterium]|nr:guanylate kinase [Bacteroidales bacterium]
MEKKVKKGKLVIFSAPSGSGKTTLVHYIMTQFSNLEFSVSATNRKARPDERDGVDYYFLSTEIFREKVAKGEFVEWEEVYDNQFYGTLRSEIERIRDKGNSVIFDVDVKGGLSIKKIYGDEALAIFIRPPSIAVLESRLRHRSTESEESIIKRIARASYELGFENKFDIVLINDELEKSKSSSLAVVTDFLNKNN